MHVAIVGCGHGEIDKIYEVIASIEHKRGIKVSLVLCCGDFQSVRNMTDLRCMACPIKYQKMHDFHRYYSGEEVAPVLTIFIGGNHEASNYLQELPYGGWVAKNIFYLSTGVLKYGPLRIGGITGIFKGRDYLLGKHEFPPYNQETMRSVYHYRNLDIFRLKQIDKPLDVFISHDWPRNIHKYGDTLDLLRMKPFFRSDIERGDFGSRPLFELLEKLQPSYWFSAHLHVKFPAIVSHTEVKSCEDGIPKMTKFLALDKVLPRRQFLQVIEFPSSNEDFELSYDAEWLAILRSTNHLLSVDPAPCYMPGPHASVDSGSRYNFSPTEEDLQAVCTLFQNNFKVESSFVQTASTFTPGERPTRAVASENPQTRWFCEKLGISDPVKLRILALESNSFQSNNSSVEKELNTDNNGTKSSGFTQVSYNPDEICLEETDDEESSNTMLESKPVSGRLPLKLPPPAVSSDIHKNTPSPLRFDELEVFRSVFTDECTENVKQNTSDLFRIDTQGNSSPDTKRRKMNEALFDSLEGDD